MHLDNGNWRLLELHDWGNNDFQIVIRIPVS